MIKGRWGDGADVEKHLCSMIRQSARHRTPLTRVKALSDMRPVLQRLGLDVQVIEGRWGDGADEEKLQDILSKDKDKRIKAVAVVHNETTTGVTSDVAKVCLQCRRLLRHCASDPAAEQAAAPGECGHGTAACPPAETQASES